MLGPLEVLADGERAAVGGPRPRAVLGTLLAHLGTAVPVDRLIDQAWQDTPPPTAVASREGAMVSARRSFPLDDGQGRARRPKRS